MEMIIKHIDEFQKHVDRLREMGIEDKLEFNTTKQGWDILVKNNTLGFIYSFCIKNRISQIAIGKSYGYKMIKLRVT